MTGGRRVNPLFGHLDAMLVFDLPNITPNGVRGAANEHMFIHQGDSVVIWFKIAVKEGKITLQSRILKAVSSFIPKV